MKKIQKTPVNFKLQPCWAIVFTMFAFVFLVSPAKAQQIRIGSGMHFVNGTNVIVNGDSIVNQGTIKNKATGVIKLTGNWKNNGACTNEKGSVVTLSGSSVQIIGGTNPTTFGTLNLNNSAGFSLAKNTTVNGKLDFQSGMLTTGNYLLTIGDTGTIANAATTKYVNGKLAIAFSSLGTKPFPIGKGGNYRPVTLQFTGLTGTSIVAAEQFETGLSGTLPENTTLLTSGRHWTINQSGGSNMQYFVTLDATGYTPLRPVLMVKLDAGTMVSSATTAPNYTNSAALSSFSDFGLGEACINPTNGGTLSQDQVNCNSFDPEEITGTLPSGNTGIIEYKWQKSTTSDISGFTDIAGSNFVNYNPGTVVINTWFRRLARVDCKTTWDGAAISNVVKMTVRPPFITSVATGVKTICWNTTAGELSATAASGGSGPYGYQWQNSPDAVNWADMEGETSLLLIPGELAETTYYRLKATDQGTPSCSGDITSNVVKITVRDPLAPSVLSMAGSQTICNGTIPGLITATPSTGGSGPPFVYQWQMNATGNWEAVGTGSLTYQPGALTANTQFRIIAVDNGTPSCGAVYSLNNISDTVQTVPNAGSIAADQAICTGTTPVALTSVVDGSTSTPGGVISYIWKYSVNSGTS